MSSIQSASPAKLHAEKARYFFTGASILLFVLMFLGFQLFYLKGQSFPGREITPPIKTQIILHGIFMSAWMILLVVQPFLIASRKRQLHMKLGWLGLVLAILAFIFGFQVGVGAARIAPPEFILWGLNGKEFLAISVISIVGFAALVIAAILKRKTAEAHRTLMLLAALMVIGAATDRTPWVVSLYEGSLLANWFGPYVSSVVILGLLAIIYRLLTGRFSRWLCYGLLGLCILSFFTMRFAKTSAWDAIATMLM